MKWSNKEINFLCNNYSIHGALFCTEELDRTIEAVRVKANRLNLERNGIHRYNRVDAPNGYIYCYKCKQILEESKFYKKNKFGKYGKKSNMCRSCCQIKAKKNYDINKSSSALNRRMNPEKNILKNIKGRAKKNNMSFDLTIEDIKIPKKCPVLCIPIIPFSNSDNSPSVDRINNNLGYTKHNIIIVSKRANRIKNDATVKELEKIWKFYKSVQ